MITKRVFNDVRIFGLLLSVIWIYLYVSEMKGAVPNGGEIQALVAESSQTTQDGTIQLIVRGDDMGFSSAANRACIQAYQQGILTAVEVIVPGPWFIDAAWLLNENPDLDVGIHLTLTSEWDNYKWGPITNTPGVMNEDGYFPGTDDEFRQLHVPEADAEIELRAQIELALKYIPHVSHLSTHMGAPTSTRGMISIVTQLSEEYNLPLNPYGMNGWQDMWATPADQKETRLAAFISGLTSGRYGFVCHLALLNDETLSIAGSGHDANTRMAYHRQAETDALLSSSIKQIILDKQIQLIGYKDTYNGVSLSESQADWMKPATFSIGQNYPNPFNGSTIIPFHLNRAEDVCLRIYNMKGQELTMLLCKLWFAFAILPPGLSDPRPRSVARHEWKRKWTDQIGYGCLPLSSM